MEVEKNVQGKEEGKKEVLPQEKQSPIQLENKFDYLQEGSKDPLVAHLEEVSGNPIPGPLNDWSSVPKVAKKKILTRS